MFLAPLLRNCSYLLRKPTQNRRDDCQKHCHYGCYDSGQTFIDLESDLALFEQFFFFLPFLLSFTLMASSFPLDLIKHLFCLIMYILYFATASLSIVLLLKMQIFYPSSSQHWIYGGYAYWRLKSGAFHFCSFSVLYGKSPRNRINTLSLVRFLTWFLVRFLVGFFTRDKR